jgi:hypothetical protein
VTQVLATAHAEAEFERYDAEQRRLEAAVPSSDFDRLIEASDKLKSPVSKPPARGKKS